MLATNSNELQQQAELYLRQGQYDEAIALYEQAIESDLSWLPYY